MSEYDIELKKPIRGLAISQCEITYHTKSFWYKQEDETANNKDYNFIEIRNKSSKEPWYPYIKSINYHQEKEVNGRKRKLYYSIPSFYQQKFYNDQAPLKEIKKETPEILDDHALKVKHSALYISDSYSTVERDGNQFNIPDSIKIYDEDENEIVPMNWHSKTGRIHTYEDITDSTIYIDYVYKTKYFDYRGYWLDDEQFVTLNLNTNPGNTYLDIHPYEQTEPEIKPGIDEGRGLNNKNIYFYLKPQRIEDELYSLSDDYSCDILLHPRFSVEYELTFEDEEGEIIQTESGSDSISNLDDTLVIADSSDFSIEEDSYTVKVEDNSPRTENGHDDIVLEFDNGKKEIEVSDDTWELEVYSRYDNVVKEIEIDVQNPVRTEELPDFSEFDLEDEELVYDSDKNNEYELTFEIDETNIPEQDTDVPSPTVKWELSTDRYGLSDVYEYNTDIDLNDSLIIELFDPQSNDYTETEYIYKETRSTVFHTIGDPLRPSHPFVSKDIKDGYYDFEDILHLGKVNVSPVTDIDKVETKDIRQRGGGIKENKIKEIIKEQDIQPALYDYDSIDGKEFPKNNTVVIEIPKEILEENGGYLTKEEVEEKVEKYLALGNLPIILYK